VAATVADELGIPHDEVIVIDARDDLLALDILRRTIDPYVLVGRREALLNALGQIAGVHVTEETDVCSEGMLGWISADTAEATAALDLSREMVAEIERRIASRAIVFSTGPEVITGQIRDTNKPWIIHRLQEDGFAAMPGEDLPDDGDTIAVAIREAVEERGYGLVVTTGGVGAEGKDGTVEALLSIDPDAATPVIFEVEAGHGRHAKPGCAHWCRDHRRCGDRLPARTARRSPPRGGSAARRPGQRRGQIPDRRRRRRTAAPAAAPHAHTLTISTAGQRGSRLLTKEK